ncbi:RHS repeat-associated core domain-containing protein [Clostridium sp. HBUAS56010]|uniref:RHS repeat-associated core domain-containing protein n=1 Tax=Clostridium sp. HBUAS56010 TaxID=2571127 RepID=UPI001177611A|nr:RHS repeat-associated core domain-containing protein [Clostridium sp. HBUAS56010]
MDDKKTTKNYIDNDQWEVADTKIEDSLSKDENQAKVWEVQLNQSALPKEEGEITDIKQYPQSPYTYFETNKVNVQLSTGDVQYETTDFVLPGRDGFDVSIARRYDSGCANLVDMFPTVKKDKIKTGSINNSFYVNTYGLGYGWSFVLPSIETVLYVYYSSIEMPIKEIKPFLLPTIGYDYILHLEDGRNLKIRQSSDGFESYNLKDVRVITRSGTIQHPYAVGVIKKYDIIIEYKNGNKDYFKNLSEIADERDGKYAQRFTLVSRQDKFGNVICYDLKSQGGMEIVDTWGRIISLEKTEYGLTWRLPESTIGKANEFSYHIDHTDPLKLTGVTDPAGHRTQYSYFNPEEYTGIMRYASKKTMGYNTGDKERKFMLLKSITYPNNASTQLIYGKKISIVNDAGGILTHFALTTKKDTSDGTEYNLAEYRYRLESRTSYDSGNGEYIEYAEVKHHQDILENHQFDREGKLLKKEIRHQNALISKGVYKYNNKLIVSSVEQEFDRNDEQKFLEKRTSWKYSSDQKADIIQYMEEYPDDPSCNQEVNTSYGDYSIILETERKNGSDRIRETNELHTELGNRVIKYRRIYENGVLKEKTKYEYKDSNNPYCVTNEKRYFLADSGDLEQSDNCTEIIFKYSSPSSSVSKYTHNFISKEQTGIIDMDGKPCDSIKEEFQYDNWGRLIYKKDSRNQVSTIRYDILGRVEEEALPPVEGQQSLNKTYYNDFLNYITKTDANNQKRRIYYTPFGQVQRICLTQSDEPVSNDIVLKDYRYNSWRELTEAVTYDGNGTSIDHIRKTENYTYDSFGRILSYTIPQVGYEENYEYNEVCTDLVDGKKYFSERKRVVGDIFAPDIITESYKDQKGRVRKKFLAGERIYSYEYDNAGNNIQRADASNRVERWEYDYAGRTVKSIWIDSGHERVTNTQFDALGNKRFYTDEVGNKTEFRYDRAGRLIQIDTPFDHRTQIIKYYYDAAGNIIAEKKAQKDGWQETKHTYDARNRLTDTYQYLSQGEWIRTVCRYDGLDQIILRRTGDTPSKEGREVTKYAYDCFGNVTKITDSCGYTEYYQYDKTGRLQVKTDRNKNRTIYYYGAMDYLLKETVQKPTPAGTVVSEREYFYGSSGKKIREVSRESVAGEQTVFLETNYRYNNKGQMVLQVDPGTIEKNYTYDIYGNRQSFQLIKKGETAPQISLYYVYDDLYRLKQVRKGNVAGEILAEYQYDEKGNRKTLFYPQSAIEVNYKYNHGNKITSLENKRNGIVISSWEYVYDVDGNIVSKTSKDDISPVNILYQYDRLGRLTEEDYSGWKRSIYTYDSYSNRIKMMVQGKTKGELVHVTSYEYGLNNRLEKEIKKQGKITETHRYRYDDNGNEIFRIWEKTAPTPDYPGNVKLSGSYQRETPTVYEWRHYNGFDQLNRVNQDDKEIIYQYRGDGLRHSTEVRKLTEDQGKTSLYYWDESNITAEQKSDNKITTYLRGINLIASETDRVVYYFIFNEHGDVTTLLSQSGTCRASYEYDAFGFERNQNKDDGNPFRYCGEFLDSDTNTYYLRARSYRSESGRFLTEDSVGSVTRKMPNEQEITDPLSLNKYTYCHNNPLLYTDPSGHIPLLVLTAIAGLVAGAIAGAVSSSMQGGFSWTSVAKGAAIGATIGLTGGGALAYGVTGSVLASTGSVASSLGYGVTTVGPAGAAGFAQARQLVQAQQMRVVAGAGNVAKFDRNVKTASELDPNTFNGLTDNGTIKVNTSGSNRPLTSTPNSYYKTANGEHIFTYDSKGKLIYDISSSRVKGFELHINPNTGQEFYKDVKLKGDVPDSIKNIFGWR